jgi:hypothetical protein
MELKFYRQLKHEASIWFHVLVFNYINIISYGIPTWLKGDDEQEHIGRLSEK